MSKYNEAVVAALKAQYVFSEVALPKLRDLPDSARVMLRLAAECDRLQEVIARDARYMAEKFAAYAEYIASGRTNDSPPTAYSTVRDVERNAAAYEANTRALASLMEHLADDAGHHAFVTALKGGGK